MKKIAVTLLLAVVLVVLLLLLPFKISPDYIENIKLGGDIIRTVATLVTMTIAITLFDRFGMKKRVLEKQTDTVIDLIESLKNTSFQIKGEAFTYIIWFKNDLSLLREQPFFANDKDKIVVFRHGMNIMIPKKIDSLQNELWLPNDIKKKLSVFDFNGSQAIPLNEIDVKKYMIVEFEKENQDWVIIKEKQTLEQFLVKVEGIMVYLISWLKKNAGVTDLNVKH